MMPRLRIMGAAMLFVLTFLSVLGSGLMAGIFFAFSTFVMQALGKPPASVGIAAMQSINRTILNPVFFLVFFGSAALGIAAAVIGWSDTGAAWRLAGALLYLAGSIGITTAFNVPLNNRLADALPDSADGAAIWTRYLATWTAWNHVRTVGCLGATGSFVLGMP